MLPQRKRPWVIYHRVPLHCFRAGSKRLSRLGRRDDEMPDKIKIMTYNIHSCFGADGKVTAERIAEVIAAAGEDIIALQEVDSVLAR